MSKAPISLTIFRLFLGVALVSLLGLIYWSNLLIEQDVNRLEDQIEDLQSEIERLSELPTPSQTSVEESDDAPNLLTPDPFYTTTLPKMLGPQFRPSGDFRQATIGKPKNLHPFSNWAQVSQWNFLCSITLSDMHFGIYETMAPGAAKKIEEKINPETGEPEFWISLRSDLYWEPLSHDLDLDPWFKKRHRVTAHDFKFYFDAMMNPFVQEAGAVASRTYYRDIESFEVIDDTTMVVRWKTQEINGEKKTRYAARLLTGGLRPLASFVYQYFPNGEKIVQDDADPDTYRKDSVWAQNFAEHWAKNVIVSCGPWVFKDWNEKRIKFRRNSRFYDRYAALIGERTTTFKSNPNSPWQDFKVGMIESVVLRPDQLVEWDDFQQSQMYRDQKKEGDGIERLDYLGRNYFFIGWNQATPFFQSQKVRQAMTMAIDRTRIINGILNGLGVEITGPFFIGSSSYDHAIKPWPFDPVAAKRLLEEEGWYDYDDDGIRNKEVDGKVIPFSFALTYYVKNDTTKAICEYVATALKQIGVDCQLNGVDLADLSAMFDDKSFEALSLGWGLGTPPEDPRQLWSSAGAKVKGSSNAVGFSNQEADQIIDDLEFTYDRKKRLQLYHRFHQIIHEEAPYTFLYTPKVVYLYRSRLKNAFIPAERQDLIPGADVAEPQSSIYWLQRES